VQRGVGALGRRGLLLAAVVVLLLPLVEVPRVDASDLERARQERAEIQERLDRATERLGEIEARAAELADERDELDAELDGLEAEIDEASERITDRVRSVYMRGHVDPVMILFTAEDTDEVVGHAAVVASLVRGDQAQSELAAAKRAEAGAVAERLAEQQAALDEAIVEQEEVNAQLQADLERAKALEARLEREERERRERERREAERRRAEQEAQRRAAQREAEQQAAQRQAQQQAASQQQTSSGGYVCPVAKPHSFTDTWGAPRSGGRTHQGTDIMAPRGAHIYAVTSGRVDIRGYGQSAGYWLILRGSDGTNYYYMHLDGYAVGSGPVSAGQLIGYNGDTGNARGTPHLHFEQHPGGSGPINPYAFLRSIC
jgi:peptidoglycan LD-endopeptidase LytH